MNDGRFAQEKGRSDERKTDALPFAGSECFRALAVPSVGPRLLSSVTDLSLKVRADSGLLVRSVSNTVAISAPSRAREVGRLGCALQVRPLQHVTNFRESPQFRDLGSQP